MTFHTQIYFVELEPLHPPFIFRDKYDKDHLYRGIKESELNLVEKVRDLDNIVDYSITDDVVRVGGNNLTLIKIKKVPADIRIQELTKKQVKKILCDQIDLCVDCLKRKVCIADISESNILYWGGKSYFIDLNAFSCPDSRLTGMPFSYVRMSYMLNKYLFNNKSIGSSIHASHKTIKSYNDWSSRNWTKHQDIDLWIRFKEYVHSCAAPKPKGSHWSCKYANDLNKLESNKKFSIVQNIIEDLNGYSVLDIGTNKGYYLNMFKKKFDRLIGFDIDESCVDIAEEWFGDGNTTFVNFGIEDCFGDRSCRPDRYKSDLVLALAVTHHFSTNNIDIKKAAEAIANMSNDMILIEDISDCRVYDDTFSKKGFKVVKKVDSYPSDRKLSLWRKL